MNTKKVIAESKRRENYIWFEDSKLKLTRYFFSKRETFKLQTSNRQDGLKIISAGSHLRIFFFLSSISCHKFSNLTHKHSLWVKRMDKVQAICHRCVESRLDLSRCIYRRKLWEMVDLSLYNCLPRKARPISP